MPIYQIQRDPGQLWAIGDIPGAEPPTLRTNSFLPSDVLLGSQGVRFEGFNPFPIQDAGEVDLERGEFALARTDVGLVLTANLGASERAVIGRPDALGERERRQATARPTLETEAFTPLESGAAGSIQTDPLDDFFDPTYADPAALQIQASIERRDAQINALLLESQSAPIPASTSTGTYTAPSPTQPTSYTPPPSGATAPTSADDYLGLGQPDYSYYYPDPADFYGGGYPGVGSAGGGGIG